MNLHVVTPPKDYEGPLAGSRESIDVEYLVFGASRDARDVMTRLEMDSYSAQLQDWYASSLVTRFLPETIETATHVLRYVVERRLCDTKFACRVVAFTGVLLAAKFHEVAGTFTIHTIARLSGGKVPARDMVAVECELLDRLDWSVLNARPARDSPE